MRRLEAKVKFIRRILLRSAGPRGFFPRDEKPMIYGVFRRLYNGKQSKGDGMEP
jgi:hypothetical protein